MNITFAKNLLKYFNEHNLSLKDFAQDLEVPISTVHGWLNGTTPRNIITLKKIALFLSCSIDELCFDEKKITSQKSHKLESNLTLSLGDVKYQVVLLKMND